MFDNKSILDMEEAVEGMLDSTVFDIELSTMAVEGFLCDPEATTSSLLDTVRNNLQTKVTTADAALELLNKISDQIAHFNNTLTEIGNIHSMAANGEISKETMVERVTPLLRDLKENCVALNLCECVEPSNADDISERELALLREFLIGCKEVAQARYDELDNMPGADRDGRAATVVDGEAHPDPAEESMGILATLCNEMEAATESSMSHSAEVKALRKSMEAQTANNLYKQAKEFHKLGRDDKAVPLMEKAARLYRGLANKASKKTGRSIEPWGSYSMQGVKTYPGSSGSIIMYFEDRATACEAYIQKWKNRDNKTAIKDLKRQRKSEVKTEKLNQKDAKKAAKAAKKSATESYEITDDTLDMMALEADLGMDIGSLSDFDNADEALEEMAIESQIELWLLEDGFDPNED